MDFNRYFTNEEVEEILQQWAAFYPALFSIQVIGKSYEKRPIFLATITNQESGPAEEKPAVWLDANLHATEIAGTTAVLHIADTLLRGYENDEQCTRLLDHATFYIVPRINPDGAAQVLAESPRFPRSGIRSYPWEEPAEGLHIQDIDGDGRILQMRIQDDSGDWKVSTLDERMMEKRAPDEHGGTYYRLLPEGLLHDYDGHIIKMAPPHAGLDFNRNFPYQWRAENEQAGAGPYPVSEPETRAIVDFLVQHPNINVGITYHTYSGVILRPFGASPDEEMETNDLWVFEKMGEIGADITGYPCVSVYHDFRYHPKQITTGTFDDYLYDQLGHFAFTVELWDLVGEAGIKERKWIEWFRKHPHEHDLKILEWLDQHGEHDAYATWTPFEHPQLGPVEIGGWNRLYSWRNPPPGLMQREAERNTPFALSLGDMLPRLNIRSLETKSLGTGYFLLEVVVENTGFLPSYTSLQGKKRRVMRPVRAEITLPEGIHIQEGQPRIELGHLEGRSNKLSVSHTARSPTDNRAKVSWLLHAPEGGSVQLSIRSERAGAIHEDIELTLK